MLPSWQPLPPHLKLRTPRHAALVRVTHWITSSAFLALLITGGEIVISHPRFYWGETGNVMTRPLFTMPIPSSRDTVPTGYGYVMPDQNGWSRALHFRGRMGAGAHRPRLCHLRLLQRPLPPQPVPCRRRPLLALASAASSPKYSAARRPASRKTAPTTCCSAPPTSLVIFVLVPARHLDRPGHVARFHRRLPDDRHRCSAASQTARTLHFFVSGSLVLFLVVHVTMVVVAGFRSRMRAMITGRLDHNPRRSDP